MKTIKSNIILLVCLVLSATSFAQTTKLKKNFKTKQDVSVEVDAKYTKVLIEHWDKNEVAIDAYLETGNINEEEKYKALENWKLEASGTADRIVIKSGGASMGNMNMELDMAKLEESMGNLQDLLKPMMANMIAPMLEQIDKNPLPPKFHEKMGKIDFDYDAYKKDGEKYLEKWEKKMEKNFGKDFEKSMEEWAKQFEENSELWEKEFSKKMEAWGENFEEKFGKDMEKWGEEFGKKMETWGEDYGKKMENAEGLKGKLSNNNMGTRVIKIKLPKNAKLDLNIRYGELKLSDLTNNLKAKISHSKLEANSIEGKDTRVEVSYSPVNVAHWKYGVLKTNYVENCEIGKAKSIKLLSNSSEVTINEITETGIISGTFGELTIGKLASGFKNLDIDLENSDLRLSLPSSALNFNYKGTKSDIQYPKSGSIKQTKSYDNELLNGYYKSKDAGGNVNINASYSDVYIK